ncbi:MAG: hypothetical protein Q9210_007618, partial [Variospora velana]
ATLNPKFPFAFGDDGPDLGSVTIDNPTSAILDNQAEEDPPEEDGPAEDEPTEDCLPLGVLPSSLLQDLYALVVALLSSSFPSRLSLNRPVFRTPRTLSEPQEILKGVDLSQANITGYKPEVPSHTDQEVLGLDVAMG